MVISLKIFPGRMLESVPLQMRVYFSKANFRSLTQPGLPVGLKAERAHSEGKIQQKSLSLLNSQGPLGGSSLWLRLALENIHPLPSAFTSKEDMLQRDQK